MTGPRTDQDVERALSLWMQEAAPTRPPIRLLEETFAETMRASQDGVRPWNRIDAGRAARRGWGPGPVLAVAVVVVLLAAVLVVALSAGAPPQMAPPTPSPSLVAVAGAPTPTPSLPSAISVTPEASIDVDRPFALAAGGAFLWIMGPARLDRINPRSNTITGSTPIGAATDEFDGLAADYVGVWATDMTSQRVVRVDPATLKVVARVPGALAPKGVLAMPGAEWVADLHGGALLRLDPATDKVAATVPVGPQGASGPNWLGRGFGSIWVDIPSNQTVVRVDESTDTVQASITIPPNVTACGGFAIGTDAVWVSSCDGGSVIMRLEPVTNRFVRSTDLHGTGYNPVLINGDVWISVDPGTADAGYLARINQATNEVDRVLVPGTAFGGGGDIAVADGSVWVTDGYHGKLLRLPMTAFAP